MKHLITALVLLAGLQVQAAKITEKMVEYKLGDVLMEGYLAMPAKAAKGTPAVVIVHEWMGLSEHAKESARKLAQAGYVAFAADIYGKGVRPNTVELAAKTAGQYKGNRPLLQARAKAAVDEVLKLSVVDPNKVVGMGYCFGGTTALEMGRAGLPLAGFVSFHGNLDNPQPAAAKNFKGKVLVLHGAIDPYVSEKELNQFEKEMNEAKVDYQMVKYSGAVHSFTNKQAGDDITKGAAYNAAADRRSWQAFMTFLGEVAPAKAR